MKEQLLEVITLNEKLAAELGSFLEEEGLLHASGSGIQEKMEAFQNGLSYLSEMIAELKGTAAEQRFAPKTDSAGNKVLMEILHREEDVKKRVAQDIYHSLSQLLFSFALKLKALLEMSKDSSMEQPATEILSSLQEAIQRIQSSSDELYPLMIEDLGAAAAIRSYLAMSKEKKKLSLPIDAEVKLSRHRPAFELQIFRITQKIVHFLHDFSESERVLIRMKEENGQIVIEAIGRGQLGEYGDISEFQEIEQRVQVMNGLMEIFQERKQYSIAIIFPSNQ